MDNNTGSEKVMNMKPYNWSNTYLNNLIYKHFIK